jgi:hypothetical protein
MRDSSAGPHRRQSRGLRPGGADYFVKDPGQADVFEVAKPSISDLHPTTKPVELIARVIANSSARGDSVYDPFGGSGSTWSPRINLAALAAASKSIPATSSSRWNGCLPCDDSFDDGRGEIG